MNRIILSFVVISVFFSCKNDNNDRDQNNESQDTIAQGQSSANEPKEGMYPYMNINGDDSINAQGNIVYGTAEEVGLEIDKEVVPQLDSTSGRMYTLGPRPVTPLLNIYGEDSISPEGDYAYPPQDTLWIESEEQQE